MSNLVSTKHQTRSLQIKQVNELLRVPQYIVDLYMDYELIEFGVTYFTEQLKTTEGPVAAAKLMFFYGLLDILNAQEMAELREEARLFDEEEEDLPDFYEPYGGYDWDDTLDDSDEGAPL